MTAICPSDPVGWLRGAVFATALRLRINGKPMPAPRPRFSRFGGAYMPKTYSEWSADALGQLGALEPLQGDLVVALDIVGERPKKTVLTAPKPDIDNLSKSVMDVLTKARAWLDDSQVVSLLARKRWSNGSDVPGINIWIAPQGA